MYVDPVRFHMCLKNLLKNEPINFERIPTYAINGKSKMGVFIKKKNQIFFKLLNNPFINFFFFCVYSAFDANY